MGRPNAIGTPGATQRVRFAPLVVTPWSGCTAGATTRQNGAMDAATLSDEERAGRLQALQDLLDLMRPAVQADGGDLVLVSADVDSGVVEVQLRGACSSCAISSATLQGGVDRILRERLPWVTEVLGGVDEDEDPYTSAAAGRGAYVPRF